MDSNASPSKRKSGEIDPGRQRKKTKAGDPQSRQQLNFIPTVVESEWQPIILSTPGLKYSAKESLHAYQSNERILLAEASHPKLDYVAQEEDSGSSESLLKHFLGIYDPKSGEVQILPTKQMVMRCRLRDGQTLEDNVQTVLDSTNQNARELLGEAFGTKKSKKAIQALANNAIRNSKSTQVAQGNDSNVVLDSAASAILETMDTVTKTMSSREVFQKTSDQSKPRPKMNLGAQQPEDVFAVEDLIGEDMIKLLDTRKWHADVKSGSAIQSTSRFVAHRVEGLVKRAEPSQKVQKDKVLRYYEALHDWLVHLRKGSRAGWQVLKREELQEKMPEVNERILDHIKRKFATGGTVNRWLQEYLYTHLCALALIVDDFQVDLLDLELDTNLERTQVQKYFEELGCRTKKMSEQQRDRARLTKQQADGRRIVSMIIPLEFPKLRVPVRRR